MNLVVINNNQFYDKKFINFLIHKIQLYTEEYIANKDYKALDYYLKNNLTSNRIITTKEIILSGIYNLVYTNQLDKYIIYIDDNQLLYDTNYHLIDICKLINFGNLEISGCHIFSDIFKHFKDNINMYYQIYLTYS